MRPSILVLGAGGQIGRALLRRAAASRTPVFGLSRRELDLLDRRAVAETISLADAPVVVNAGGFTSVDRAEREPAAAFRINRDGAGWLAEACKRRGRILIHLSTDQVFDGTQARPYRPDDPVAPLNVYGLSKSAGEMLVRAASPAHVILRSAWVHAPWGRNFVRSVVDRARCGQPLLVADNRLGSPTSADDLARCILLLSRRLAESAPGGVYHWAGRGVATRYDVAEAATQTLAEAGGPAVAVESIETAEAPASALRPAYSPLDALKLSTLLDLDPEPWRTGVADTVRGLMDDVGARALETVS